MKKVKRMGREEYYLTVLDAVKQRSTCDRGRLGAILVKDGRIISTGYVGAPAGMPHCDEVGHLIEERRITKGLVEGLQDYRYSAHCVRTVHAEQNAILQAAIFGIEVGGATMYCTMFPCFPCAKAIVNVELEMVIAVHPYQAQDQSIDLFRAVGLPFKILNQEKELY